MTLPSLKWVRSGVCLLSLLALAACGEDGKTKRTPNGDADAGDGDGKDRDGGGHDPEKDDGGSSEPDAGEEPDKPIQGGPGCDVGSLCLALRNAYAEKLQEKKSCSPKSGSEACGMQAATSLGCQTCPVWVTDTTRLDELSKQFDKAGCDECFYGSPTGDRCHPEGCNDLGAPMCDPSGTCVPDLSCPESAKDGAPCTAEDPSYCGSDGMGCICFGRTWMC